MRQITVKLSITIQSGSMLVVIQHLRQNRMRTIPQLLQRHKEEIIVFHQTAVTGGIDRLSTGKRREVNGKRITRENVFPPDRKQFTYLRGETGTTRKVKPITGSLITHML